MATQGIGQKIVDNMIDSNIVGGFRASGAVQVGSRNAGGAITAAGRLGYFNTGSFQSLTAHGILDARFAAGADYSTDQTASYQLGSIGTGLSAGWKHSGYFLSAGGDVAALKRFYQNGQKSTEIRAEAMAQILHVGPLVTLSAEKMDGASIQSSHIYAGAGVAIGF